MVHATDNPSRQHGYVSIESKDGVERTLEASGLWLADPLTKKRRRRLPRKSNGQGSGGFYSNNPPPPLSHPTPPDSLWSMSKVDRRPHGAWMRCTEGRARVRRRKQQGMKTGAIEQLQRGEVPVSGMQKQLERGVVYWLSKFLVR